MGSACAERTRGEVNRTWSGGVKRRAQGDGTRGQQKSICQRRRSTRNVRWQARQGRSGSGSGRVTLLMPVRPEAGRIQVPEGGFLAVIGGDKSEKESDRKPTPFYETNYLPTILVL
jgi:hypothetical protein